MYELRITLACRPLALFVPLAAMVFSLKTCEDYLRAILMHQMQHGTLAPGTGAPECCFQTTL